MPRRRPQREPCDCLDCVDRPDQPPSSVQVAIARQEPPPKSLVVYLHGALAGSGSSGDSLPPPPADCPHVAALLRDGVSGLLAFAAPGNDAVAATAGLLGVQDLAAPPPASLAQRFKGLAAAALTDLPAVGEVCTLAGAHAVEVLGASSSAESGELPWPEPAELAARIAQRLGVPFVDLPKGCSAELFGLAALAAPMPGDAAQPQAAGSRGAAAEVAADDDDAVDMLLLLLDASSSQQPGSGAGAQPGAGEAPEVLAWLDALLANLNLVEGFRDTVLVTVVLGAQPGLAAALAAQLRQQERRQLGGGAAAVGRDGAGAQRWPFRRPLQSYHFRGLDTVEPNPELAAVVVHRLAGVIRRDEVAALDVREVLRRGGGGCILAERLLPEVAYKLGRAPKYGA